MKKGFIATLFITIFLTLSLQATSQSQNTINIKTINGKDINIKVTDNGFIFEQYKGKTVMLDFFGPSCPPCLIEIPHLVELQEQERSKLQIIGVQVQKAMSDTNLNKFKQSKNINYDIVNLQHAMELVHFVQANTVFINNYGSEQLPIAYMLAGVVGWLSSSIYSSLQKRIHSKHLFGGALLFMFMITIIGRFALGYIEEKYLSFFVFIWAWPFISIVGIESGGLAIKLLNLTQIKRLFGLINMGGVTASIIGYLIIPVLTKIIGTSYNLFIIAATSLLAAMLLLYFIYKNFPEKEITIKQSKDKAKTNFKYLLKDKYFRLIFISATLSMTVIYIADFGFLSSIKIQKELFADSDSVAHFLALVFA